MEVLWDAMSIGIFGAPLLGVAYWGWYRLSPTAREGRPPGVVVLVTSLFVSAACFVAAAIAYVVSGAW